MDVIPKALYEYDQVLVKTPTSESMLLKEISLRGYRLLCVREAKVVGAVEPFLMYYIEKPLCEKTSSSPPPVAGEEKKPIQDPVADENSEYNRGYEAGYAKARYDWYECDRND